MKNWPSAIILCGALLYATTLPAQPRCTPDAALQQWLLTQAKGWHTLLQHYPGLEEPPPLRLCRIAHGQPHTDHGEIRLPPMPAEELRLAAAHEYLHLHFRHHPNGRDEPFIEQLARALILGEPPP
ncbi:MAG: DUF2300 domain-containing protein [Magnetococcales bacterium]|nr:DUF2300 domain-containing protein [Magnetococcales bacterium]